MDMKGSDCVLIWVTVNYLSCGTKENGEVMVLQIKMQI
jgi:hypothetical protein